MIGSLLPLELYPALILIIGGLLVPLVPETFRRIFIVALPVVGVLHFLSYPLGDYGSVVLFDYTLTANTMKMKHTKPYMPNMPKNPNTLSGSKSTCLT